MFKKGLTLGSFGSFGSFVGSFGSFGGGCFGGGGRNAVRSTASFSSGAHSWEVHIDKCVSKNIFVGVIASGGSTENYVGSDRYGW